MSHVRYFSCDSFIAAYSVFIPKLLDRIDMIGIWQRTQVSKSMPVMPIAASPQKLMHSFSGCATLAPIVRPSP